MIQYLSPFSLAAVLGEVVCVLEGVPLRRRVTLPFNSKLGGRSNCPARGEGSGNDKGGD